MNGYTKLFGSILASSVWGETKETKIVWVTMLAMADKNGEVAGSVPGLATLARLTLEETQEALAVLSAPDPYSRTKAFEGRRIRDIDGGWKIINHQKYRNAKKADERREYLRGKKRESRQKQRQQASISVNSASLSANKCGGVFDGKVDASHKANGASDLHQSLVNKSQQKSTSQQQAKATQEAEAAPLRANSCLDGQLPESKPIGLVADLSTVDWGDAVRFATAAARRVPPSNNDTSRRHWLIYGAMAAGIFGEAWLVGAGDGVEKCTKETRDTPQAHFVSILKATAKESFGISEKEFTAIRRKTEIPYHVYSDQEILGGPRVKK